MFFREWLGELPSRFFYAAAIGLVSAFSGYLIYRFTPDGFWQRSLSFDVVYLDAAVALGVVFFLMALLLYFLTRRLRSYVIYDGREKSMAANCEIIRKYLTDKTMELRSTRVTFWRLSESSDARQKFRNLLTEKITSGFAVKRLWQIKDRNDFSQLQRYLTAYASFDGYAVKAIVTKTVLIPELLCVGNKVASLSLAEPSLPREIGRTLHFRGKKEVVAIVRYFDVLWDLALPIKVANELYPASIQTIEATLASWERRTSSS